MRLSAIAWILLVGLSMPGCTTTYTQSELDAKEVKIDQADAQEDQDDEEIGEEGGQNSVDEDQQEVQDLDQGSL